MTLREMVRAHPDLFYAQTWYADEPFMDTEPTGTLEPDFAVLDFQVTPYPRRVSAADLAAAYLETPQDPKWRRFIWTDDTDRYGQRVYVGGIGIYGIDRFQIHRHLHIDQRWGWVA